MLVSETQIRRYSIIQPTVKFQQSNAVTIKMICNGKFTASSTKIRTPNTEFRDVLKTMVKGLKVELTT